MNNTSGSTNIDVCSGEASPVNDAQSQMPSMVPLNHSDLNKKSPQNQDNYINGFHSKNNLNSSSNRLLDAPYNGKSLANSSSQNHLGEELNHSSSTNWSNGTCKTSDLLF